LKKKLLSPLELKNFRTEQAEARRVRAEQLEKKNKRLSAPKKLFDPEPVVEVVEEPVVEIIKEPIELLQERIEEFANEYQEEILELKNTTKPQDVNLQPIYDNIAELKEVVSKLPEVKYYDSNIEKLTERLDQLQESGRKNSKEVDGFIYKMRQDLNALYEIEIPQQFDATNIHIDIAETKETFYEKISEIKKELSELPEVKYYDTELTELQEKIELVRDSIPELPEIPEIRYYDDDLKNLLEKIQQVQDSFSEIPEVRYYEDEIKSLEESIRDVENRIPTIPKIKSYDKDIKSLSEKIEVVESKIPEVPEIPEFPEVKYYDVEVKDLSDEINNIKDSLIDIKLAIKAVEKSDKNVEVFDSSELKLEIQNAFEEIAKLKEKPNLITETLETEPLTDNFVTFDELSKHYRVFINRVQQQLGSLGGGGIEDAPKTGGPYVRQNQAWADLGSLDILKGTTGYEFTGAFVERTTGQSGANDIGTDYEYPQSLADSQTWKRFGFSVAQQVANDNEYWGETNPNFDQTKGVFGGLYMPNGFSNMIDYSDTSVGAAVTTGNLKYTAANGSYDFTDGHPGMFAQIRFSYNITPLVAGTTVETALIWHTRNEYDDVTFSFTLTNQPITYDSNSVGRTLLSRVEITAYFASDEDVNARALPAIRADNRCIIQPLTTLVTLSM